MILSIDFYDFFGWGGLIHRKSWQFFGSNNLPHACEMSPSCQIIPSTCRSQGKFAKPACSRRWTRQLSPLRPFLQHLTGFLEIPRFQISDFVGVRALPRAVSRLTTFPTQLIMPFLEGSEGEQFLPGKCGEGNAMGWNGLGWAGNGRKLTGSAYIESRAMVNHILMGWNHNTSWFLVWLKYLQV